MNNICIYYLSEDFKHLCYYYFFKETVQCGLSNNHPVLKKRISTRPIDFFAAIFDPHNHFHGCIPGIHEVLRRQGLFEGRWCMNPEKELSPDQMEEIDRVYKNYPHLNDTQFVKDNLKRFLV